MDNNNSRKVELMNALLTEYEVGSIEELKQTAAFKDARSRSETDGQALKSMAMGVKKETTYEGFFLRHKEFFRKNDKGVIEKTGEGPTILLPDGSTRTFTVGTKLDCGELAPVKVGPLSYTKNLLKGTVSKDATTDATTVEVGPHSTALPASTLDAAIESSMKVSKYGTVYGGTGDFHTFAILSVGGPEDVDYFRVTDNNPEPTLRITCTDSSTSQNKVRFKLATTLAEVDAVLEAFGLDSNSDSEEIKLALGGERIAVYGRYGATIPKTFKDFENDSCGAEATQVMDRLYESGALEQYKTAKDGGALKRLNMGKARTALGIASTTQVNLDGTTVETPALHINIGQYRVYDIVEDKPNVWQFNVRCVEVGNIPWMDVREHPWSNANGSGIANEGAFYTFLDHKVGIRSEEDDFFDQMADTPTASASNY